MVFTSFDFVVFFCAFYVLFVSIRNEFRIYLLLLASFGFFGYAVPKHLWLLLLTIAISYVCGLGVAGDPKNRRLYLWSGVGSLLGLLVWFKYTDMAISFINQGLHLVRPDISIPPLGILLPIGISFFVFQAISYIVDVYRGDKAAERNIVLLAVYKSFFPQLVAGPIERSTNLLPNLRRAFIEPHTRHLVSPEALSSGSQLILYGFFKKVCVADNLALFSDNIFADPGKYGQAATVLGVYCFAIQIYCDFSGYTDIARGVARIMGVELMENFRRPYFSASIREFWTRWHISLSSWFRDYLYKPLGGSRVSPGRWSANIMVVFLLSGLWHGAAINFMIWGGIHGIFYLSEQFLTKLPLRLPAIDAAEGVSTAGGPVRIAAKVLAIFVTFHVACFSWIFFRARTFGDAIEVVGSITSNNFDRFYLGLEFFHRDSFAWCLLFVAVLLIVDSWAEWGSKALDQIASIGFLRWSAYYAAAVAIVLFGNWSNSQQFIYFQF